MEYTHGKQTYAQLSKTYQCSIKTIQRRLDKATHHYPAQTLTQTHLVMDTTYFGRKFGLMVFMDYSTKSILHYQIVNYETNDLYRLGISRIQEKGIDIQSVTCDGRRGLITSLQIPTQMCQFHQQQIITRYLTRNPKHNASKALRQLSLTLTKSDKNTFIDRLDNWYLHHKTYLNERSVCPETGRTWYTHKRLRSAYRSLRNNTKWLFVYQNNMCGNTPNTTNSLEGLFSELKRQLNCHKGMNMQRKLRFIKDFLCKRQG